MANFLQDYFRNLKKAKEQEARYKKIDGFVRIERDALTKRAIIICQTDATGNVSKKSRLN